MLYFQDELYNDNGVEWICELKSIHKTRIICVKPDTPGGMKALRTNNEEIIPLPDPKIRQVSYIAGPSGSGKSFYVAKYVSNYKKLFPKNDVYLFCRTDDDPAFKDLKVKYMLLNEDIYLNPIDPINELENCLLIFDDCDTLPDKKVKAALDKLKNDVMEVGRKKNIYIAITSHLINKGFETKTVMNEAQLITFFPKGGSVYNIKYLLEKYIGLDKKQIKFILGLPSTRWITIKKTFPQVCFYEHGCFMINEIK